MSSDNYYTHGQGQAPQHPQGDLPGYAETGPGGVPHAQQQQSGYQSPSLGQQGYQSPPSLGQQAYQPPPGGPPPRGAQGHPEFRVPRPGEESGGPLAGGFSGGYGEAVPPRRTGTVSEQALPQDQDRSHQVEVMQSYEMSRPQREDEQHQAILQREFPGIDSSLIAALYGDSGSLSATRELLQELSSGDAQ